MEADSRNPHFRYPAHKSARISSGNEALQANHSLPYTVTCTNCPAEEGSPTQLPRSNIALFIRQLPHESPGGCRAKFHNLEQITPFG